MIAKMVTGTIDPARIDVASHSVRAELIPGFLAREGALHGYWMADPGSGHVLAVTTWTDRWAMEGAAAAEGAERALVGEWIGLRVNAVTALSVIASHRCEPEGIQPVIRSARVTSVEGVPPDRRGGLQELFEELLSDQLGADGFRASYWFGDEAIGEGSALSLWEHEVYMHKDVLAGRRRRRRAERALGCRISSVHEYRALAAADSRVVEMAMAAGG